MRHFPSGRYPNSSGVLKRIRALSARLAGPIFSSCLILSRVIACQSNILAASDNYFKFKVSPKRPIGRLPLSSAFAQEIPKQLAGLRPGQRTGQVDVVLLQDRNIVLVVDDDPGISAKEVSSSPSLRDKVRELIPSCRATSDAVALPWGSSFDRMSSAFERTVSRSRGLRASASSA
jgi:hypothetical protein